MLILVHLFALLFCIKYNLFWLTFVASLFASLFDLTLDCPRV